ncbi:diphosphomevalonate decarboxylase, partial [Candidatus Marsarchaeota archaeon]|nr:diphosphomevalonate decarboxylase [Candidatus Marsarchaeota archaeon]
ITAIGTSNIAFIKYWGRRDEKLNLPMNSSISMTLDDTVSTKTSVLFSKEIEKDRLFINGKEERLSGEFSEKSGFIKNMLDYVRGISKLDMNALIVSENNFPSSSGLASSASGGATLVFALSHALNLGLSQRDMSAIARRISGSACRSVYGGIVRWDMGLASDGSDSVAEQVVTERHWPELMDVITIVDPSKKKVSSSAGHSATIRTSSLYATRPAFAEKGTEIVANAIITKDFQRLAETIMRDSNNMHATMLDTWPPIIYLTDISKEIMYAIHELNETKGRYVAAYTFDAGANAHIITTAESKNDVQDLLKDIPGVKGVIESRSGSGPRLLGEDTSLIDINRLGPRR